MPEEVKIESLDSSPKKEEKKESQKKIAKSNSFKSESSAEINFSESSDEIEIKPVKSPKPQAFPNPEEEKEVKLDDPKIIGSNLNLAANSSEPISGVSPSGKSPMPPDEFKDIKDL